MSQIDPVSVNKIAEKRSVILFDNAGIGRSEGQVPTSYAGWADYCAELITQLGFDQVDVLAFSMGGCAAQMLALNYPTLVRRLILVGSLPSIGPGVVLPPSGPFQGIRMANDRESQEAALLEFCFHSSETSQAAGRATFRRMLEARDDWSDLIDTDGTRRQIQAFAKFMNPKHSSEGSFGRFNELRIPVLIIRGEYMDLDLHYIKFKAWRSTDYPWGNQDLTTMSLKGKHAKLWQDKCTTLLSVFTSFQMLAMLHTGNIQRSLLNLWTAFYVLRTR